MRLASFLAAALAATLSLGTPAMAQEEEKTAFASNVIFSAPGITVPREELRYPDGSTGTLADYEGDVLIVTLYQKNCPYCVREMPVLNRLSGEMKDEGVRVVALSMDQDMGMVTGFLEQHELSNLEPIMDWEKVNGSLFSIEHFGRFSIATPTSFIVDKKGTVVARVWGLVDWDGDPARAFLRSLVLQG